MTDTRTPGEIAESEYLAGYWTGVAHRDSGEILGSKAYWLSDSWWKGYSDTAKRKDVNV